MRTKASKALDALPQAQVIGRIDPDGTVRLGAGASNNVQSEEDLRRVLTYIEKRGQVGHSKLLSGVSYWRCNAQRLKGLTLALEKAGCIETVAMGARKGYRFLSDPTRGHAPVPLALAGKTARLKQVELERQDQDPAYIVSLGFWAYKGRCVRVASSWEFQPEMVKLAVQKAAYSDMIDEKSHHRKIEMLRDEVDRLRGLAEGMEQGTPAEAAGERLVILRRGLFSHIRRRWLEETPEEIVRQKMVCTLVNDYGYSLEQMDEEVPVTGPGSAQARADIIIWRTREDRQGEQSPLAVVECKGGNPSLTRADCEQAENYARLSGAGFLMACNARERRCWRVLHDKMPKNLEAVPDIPKASEAVHEPGA
jgi:hypothetical protein